MTTRLWCKLVPLLAPVVLVTPVLAIPALADSTVLTVPRIRIPGSVIRPSGEKPPGTSSQKGVALKSLPTVNQSSAEFSYKDFENIFGAIHDEPYEFELRNALRGNNDSVTAVPESVDAAIYSDSETSLSATVTKQELKSDLLADTFLLQFSEGANSTSVIDDSGVWDAPQGLIYYEPRSIALGGKGAKYTANFLIKAQLISRLAGNVDAATGKIIYVRVVAVKARTVIEKFVRIRPSIDRGAKESDEEGAKARERGSAFEKLGKLERNLPSVGRGARETGEESAETPKRDGVSRRLPRFRRNTDLPPAREKWQLVSNPSPWRAVYIAGDKAAVAVLVAQNKKAALTADLERATNEIASRYKVEILSYIPPKLQEDLTSGAFSKELELTRDVSFKGRHWKKGQIYDPVVAANILEKKGVAGLPSEFYNLAIGVIDQTSNGWKTAKNFVVETIADGLNGSGILDCGKTCKAVITTGLNIALAYCGIPPSIPNSRELFKNGKGYIAGAVADALLEQATGLDSDTFDTVGGDALKKQARNKIMGAASSGIDRLVTEMGCPAPGAPDCGFKTDSPHTWGIPSAYFQKRPGVVWIKISRVGQASNEESPARLGVDVQRLQSTKPLTKVDVFQPTPALKLFEIPDEGLVVPVLLTPTMASYKDKMWDIAGYVGPHYEHGIPETRHGQPYYYNSRQLSITIRTSHLVTSQYAKYPQVVAKTWVVDKTVDHARPYDGIDGKITDGYFGEMPYNPVSY